jgi:threonine/homoserine/homoserine lactone efflux protein
MPPFGILGAMALFALAASATPGPVNFIGAMAGARFGGARVLPYVTGATVCFIALLAGLGAGAVTGAMWLGRFALPMTLAGSAYLLWLAWKIARSGPLESASPEAADLPGFWSGAAVQGLNPKAWLAVLSAISTFILPLTEKGTGLAVFCGLYFVICWLSLTLWAYAGAMLARRFARRFNIAMAALLAASVLLMLADALR